MRNIFNLFRKIESFETVTLHTSGMRHVTDYEITRNGDDAEVAEYAVGYRDGEEVRQLRKRAACSVERVLKFLNHCRLLSWDGFYGKRPKGIKDGTNFIFDAIVNDGTKIHASGSQKFPGHYREFTDGLRELLKQDGTGSSVITGSTEGDSHEELS